MKTAGLLFGTLALMTSLQGVRGDDVFTFAGFTFDQRNTPNQASLIGNNAVLGGATFSSGLPTQNGNHIPEFPGGSGFNGTLSLGRLTGLASTGTQAVSLPNGNVGTTTRHGIDLTWSGGRTLPNLVGYDFVIYESASTSAGTEGLMARAHSGTTWSDWYYFAPDTFQVTASPAGIHSYGFDFSDMGLALNLMIDNIQIANLIASDRINSVGVPNGSGQNVGEGQMLFGTGSVFPDAGDGFDANRLFDTSTQLDPDPLYVAALHNLFDPLAIPEPSSTLLLAGALTGFGLWRWKKRS